MEEKHIDETLDNAKVNTPVFDLAVQVIALATFAILIIVDRGLGLMKTPIPDIWYGIIGAFGVVGKSAFYAMIKRK